MKVAKIVINCLCAAVALVLVALSAEMMRESFATMLSQGAMWLSVAAWIFFIWAGLFVLGLAVAGIVLAAISAQLRKTTIVVVAVLVVCWLFLPFSPMVANLIYNSTGFTRLSPKEMTEVRDGQVATIQKMAEERGDTVTFDGEQAENAYRSVVVIEDDISKIAVELLYYSSYGRLDVSVQTVLSVDSGEEFDFLQLSCAVAYYNALTGQSLTVQECKDTALSEEFSEYSHDGYVTQLRSFSKFCYVRCYNFRSEDNFGKKDNIEFTLCGLAEVGEGV